MLSKPFSGICWAICFCFILCAALLPIATAAPSTTFEPTMMAYIHAKTNYSELVNSTDGALQQVSPDWMGVDEKGNLIIDEKKYDAAFVAEMKAKGIAVTPMLANGFLRDYGITALKNAEALTDQIVAMVKARDFDGISYDIENVTENERELQTAFVHMLRQKMPDKIISVAVCANPSGWTRGWHASYDMAALAKEADYLMLMAYDEGYGGGPERPVASISFVENCILDLLERGAPPEKIVLGLPLYGRMWSADGSQLGLGTELNQVEQVIGDERLIDKVFRYDEEAQCAVMEFTAPVAYLLYSWKNIPAGRYTLYYENERSLKQKITLMHKYNLQGLGFWSLGQADAAIWNILVPYSQGRFYEDIPTHWAYAPISYSINSGWMRWIKDKEFLPEEPVLRSQVAAALNGFFKLTPPAAEDAWAYADFTPQHWAWQSVQAVVYNGMMSSMDAERTIFGPEAVFTRAQFASIFDRLISVAEFDADRVIELQALQNPYSDLTDDHWAKTPLLRMVQRELLAGYDGAVLSDGSLERLMQPDKPISRAELAVMLQRMEKWFGFSSRGKWRVELEGIEYEDDDDDEKQYGDDFIYMYFYLPGENAEGWTMWIIPWGGHIDDIIVHYWATDLYYPHEIFAESFEINGRTGYLDMNEAFLQSLQTGSTAEYYRIGCLVNSVLRNFDLDELYITVNGNVIETGHNTYTEPFTFFGTDDDDNDWVDGGPFYSDGRGNLVTHPGNRTQGQDMINVLPGLNSGPMSHYYDYVLYILRGFWNAADGQFAEFFYYTFDDTFEYAITFGRWESQPAGVGFLDKAIYVEDRIAEFTYRFFSYANEHERIHPDDPGDYIVTVLVDFDGLPKDGKINIKISHVANDAWQTYAYGGILAEDAEANR